MFQHDFPDAVRHHYRSAGVDEDVLLYRGEFSYPGDERSFAGDVRFSWRPSPSIKVRGERPASPAALHGLLSAYEDQGMWVEPGRVLIELADGVLPDQPGEPSCHDVPLANPSRTSAWTKSSGTLASLSR